MKRSPSAVSVLAGAAALVTSSLLVAAPAAHAEPVGGALTVNIVDQYGRPTTGVVELFASSGGGPVYAGGGTGGTPVASASQVYSALDAGDYGVMSVTPWSGTTCLGLLTCSAFTSSSPSLSPSAITVTDGSAATITLHVTVPSITGNNTVGSPLTVQIPQSLTDMTTALGTFIPLYGSTMSQQWMRGAADVPGATGTSYTTVREDGAQPMSARLTPSAGVSYMFLTAGMSVPSFTTNAVAMRPTPVAATKTKVKLAKHLHHGDRASAKIKVSSTGGVPSGFVTLKIGKFKAKKALKNGTAFVTLPSLRAGTYKAKVTYGGATYFAASKAKKVTVTISR